MKKKKVGGLTIIPVITLPVIMVQGVGIAAAEVVRMNEKKKKKTGWGDSPFHCGCRGHGRGWGCERGGGHGHGCRQCWRGGHGGYIMVGVLVTWWLQWLHCGGCGCEVVVVMVIALSCWSLHHGWGRGWWWWWLRLRLVDRHVAWTWFSLHVTDRQYIFT